MDKTQGSGMQGTDAQTGDPRRADEGIQRKSGPDPAGSFDAPRGFDASPRTGNPGSDRSYRKGRKSGFLSKIPSFCVGLVAGGIAALLLVLFLFGVSVFSPEVDNKSTVNMLDLEKKIESCSDLITTKVSYAGIEVIDAAKVLSTPLGDAPLPFTDKTTIVAYKGVIGLGFDISAIKHEIDDNSKLITITLPKLEILYNDFNNSDTQSFNIRESIFNPSTFEESNDFIEKIKQAENESVLNDEGTMSEAADNAKNVLFQIVSSWSGPEGYTVEVKQEAS